MTDEINNENKDDECECPICYEEINTDNIQCSICKNYLCVNCIAKMLVKSNIYNYIVIENSVLNGNVHYVLNLNNHDHFQ